MFGLPSVADAFWVGCIRRWRTMRSTNTVSVKVVWSSSLRCAGGLGGQQHRARRGRGRHTRSLAAQGLNLIVSVPHDGITPDLQMIPDSTELALW